VEHKRIFCWEDKHLTNLKNVSLFSYEKMLMGSNLKKIKYKMFLDFIGQYFTLIIQQMTVPMFK